MPISVKCEDCGKSLKAPDSAAGKKSKCPGCGSAIQIPEPVYDAEEIKEDEVHDVEDYEEAEPAEDDAFAGFDAEEKKSGRRRPCPACGEMIMETAVKCRYCDEVFDKSAGSLKRGTREKSKLDSSDRELLKKFRGGMNGLGGFCIFALLICVGAGAVFAFAPIPNMADEGRIVVGIVMMVLAALWLVFGIFCFKRKVWAAYSVGVLSALNVIANLFQLNVIGLAISGAVTWSAFNAASQARELRRRGVSLDARF